MKQRRTKAQIHEEHTAKMEKANAERAKQEAADKAAWETKRPQLLKEFLESALVDAQFTVQVVSLEGRLNYQWEYSDDTYSLPLDCTESEYHCADTWTVKESISKREEERKRKALRDQALAKLTPEEKEALGYRVY